MIKLKKIIDWILIAFIILGLILIAIGSYLLFNVTNPPISNIGSNLLIVEIALIIFYLIDFQDTYNKVLANIFSLSRITFIEVNRLSPTSTSIVNIGIPTSSLNASRRTWGTDPNCLHPI